MARNAVSNVAETSVESSASGIHWGAILGGALGAVGITFIVMAFGPAFGLTSFALWTPTTSSPASFGIRAGIWLIVTQWVASGGGGYLAGRLREKWVGVRTDEVFFRDTAHGFLAWATAALIVVVVLMIGSSIGVATTPLAGGAAGPEVSDAARKAVVAFSFYSGLSLLIGAFIACVTAALGGYHRDEM